MIELINYLIGQIVDHPKEIKVEEKIVGDNSYLYFLQANKEDIGKIIGRDGKTIQAIRNILKIMAIKENKQIRLEIL